MRPATRRSQAETKTRSRVSARKSTPRRPPGKRRTFTHHPLSPPWPEDDIRETRFTFETLPAYLGLYGGIPLKCRDGRYGVMDPDEVRKGVYRLRIRSSRSPRRPVIYSGVEDLIAKGWVVS